MPKNDQEEAYEKLMLASLTRILDAQKFAETKNAALLTFNTAWIIGGANLLFTNKPLPGCLPVALGMALPVLAVSAFGCLWSFLPELRLKHYLEGRRWFQRWIEPYVERHHWLKKWAKPSEPHIPSMIFFGHIAAVEPQFFRTHVEQQYMAADGRSLTEAYKRDLADQISINSGIAARKFRIFTICAGITFFAMIVIAISIADWVYAKTISEIDAYRSVHTDIVGTGYI